VMVQLGILIYSAAVAFAMVTLPVEFDASARAMHALREEGLVTADELRGVRAVLTDEVLAARLRKAAAARGRALPSEDDAVTAALAEYEIVTRTRR